MTYVDGDCDHLDTGSLRDEVWMVRGTGCGKQMGATLSRVLAEDPAGYQFSEDFLQGEMLHKLRSEVVQYLGNSRKLLDALRPSDRIKVMDDEIKKLEAMIEAMRGTVMEGTSTYWRLVSLLNEKRTSV